MQTAVKTRLGQRQPPPLHPPSYHHHHSTTLHHHLIQTYAIRDYSRLLYQSHKSTPLKLMQSVVIFWIKCLKGVVRSNYHIIINRFSKFSCTRNTKVVYMLYIAMRARVPPSSSDTTTPPHAHTSGTVCSKLNRCDLGRSRFIQWSRASILLKLRAQAYFPTGVS